MYRQRRRFKLKRVNRYCGEKFPGIGVFVILATSKDCEELTAAEVERRENQSEQGVA
jgi:hypothetical protein